MRAAAWPTSKRARALIVLRGAAEDPQNGYNHEAAALLARGLPAQMMGVHVYPNDYPEAWKR